MALAPGTQVRHARYGPGVVARVMDGGLRVLVRFDRRPAVPYVLPSSQFEATAPPPQVRAPPRPPRPASPQGDRQSLEALRLGVVPPRGLEALTVGRVEELARIDQLVDEARGMVVVSGGYGTGKTHLIELAEAHGLARGMLVARATFDPVEVPPSHPLRLYRALATGLRYPGSPGTGLRPLFDKLGDSAEHISGRQVHRWLSPALFAVQHADEALADDVLDYVSGASREDMAALDRRLRRAGFRGKRMLALPDYRTFGQIMSHLLGGLAVWARDAGWRGVLVLLDEAEYIDRLGATSREMAENVLRYLAMGSLPPELLAFEPRAVYRGGQAVHKAIDPAFAADQPLAVLCAFTPNPEVDRVLRRTLLDPTSRLRLEAVRPSLLPVLAERIYGLVKRVHPTLDPDPAYRAAVAAALAGGVQMGNIETTRQAARLVVEFWDLYRADPLRALRALGTG